MEANPVANASRAERGVSAPIPDGRLRRGIGEEPDRPRRRLDGETLSCARIPFTLETSRGAGLAALSVIDIMRRFGSSVNGDRPRGGETPSNATPAMRQPMYGSRARAICAAWSESLVSTEISISTVPKGSPKPSRRC